MNTLLSSVNLSESLQQNETFAKFYKPLDEMELKTMSKVDLQSIKNELLEGLNSIKHKKSLFIYSTKQMTKSRSYKNQMLQFEIRKLQLNENLNKVNKLLSIIKEDYLIKERARQETESKFLYYFWKAAKENLKTFEYKKISEIAQSYCPFPETLVR